MKKTSLVLSIIALLLAAVSTIVTIAGPGKGSKKAADKEAAAENITAVAGDIVFIQLDSLINNYDMFNDLMSAFQTKAAGVEDELNKKGRKLESDMKAFENQVNKGLLTRSAAEQQQQNLIQRQQNFQNEAAQRQGELQEEQIVINNRIYDAVKTYIDNYNAQKQFSLIITTSGASNTVLTGDPGKDVTAEVLAGLNEEYIKVRNTVKNE